MKRTLLLFAAALLFSLQSYAQTGVAINTTGNEPDTSAMLDVSSTEKGILIPRLTQAQRNAIAIPAEGLMIFQTDESAGFYYYQTSWKFVGSSLDYNLLTNKPVNATSTNNGFMSSTDKTKLDGFSTVHYIGENYGGGIIFWLDATKQHGLIAATSDQSSGGVLYSWSINPGYTGATFDGVYAGKSNTRVIIANQGTGSYAAKLCDDYAVSVNNEYYEDWYLPSKYELNLLYSQKSIIGGFISTDYWSSSEKSYSFANVQNFTTGTQYSNWKLDLFGVRAVRAF